MKKKYSLVIVLILMTIISVVYQSCGPIGAVKGDDEISLPSTLRSGLNFTSPNLVSDCFNSQNFNACIIWKNPVAHLGQPFPTALSSGNYELSKIQVHAVNISGLDGSGFLQSKDYVTRVIFDRDSTGAPRNTAQFSVSTAVNSNPFKVVYENRNQHLLSMITSYYYLDLLKLVMETETGGFYATGKSILVNTDYSLAANAQWDASRNQMLLGVSPTGFETSLMAEVIIHEMGHANLDYAMVGGGTPSTDPNAVNCGTSRCCNTKNGCIGAIHEGVADFHSVIMFPLSPVVGESFTNDVKGIKMCGHYRNYDLLGKLSARQAYSACSEQGEIHMLGNLYASIWHVVRQGFTPIGSQGWKDINQIFGRHLKELSDSDTFLDALVRIKTIDSQSFQGKYSKAFEAEFAARGL